MSRHSNDAEGRADDWHACLGENRADPDSWDDPDITDAWEDPEEVEPTRSEWWLG